MNKDKNYNDIEISILKKNPGYKQAIDEYHKWYNNKTDDIIISVYYKVIIKAYKECAKINCFKNLDDIISKATISVLERISTGTKISNLASYIANAVNIAMKPDKPESFDTVPLQQCCEYCDEYADTVEDICYINIISKYIALFVKEKLTERNQKILRFRIEDDLTLAEIANYFDIAPARVADINATILRKLRHRLNIKFHFIDDNHCCNRISSNSEFGKSSSGRTFADAEDIIVLASMENTKTKRYLLSLRNPHSVRTTDELLIGSHYHYCIGNFNSILFDSIITGNFHMIDNPIFDRTLCYFFKNIDNIEGMKDTIDLFAQFTNAKYTPNQNYISATYQECIAIEAMLFRAFYSAIEYAIKCKSALAGFYKFESMYNEYSLSRFFDTREDKIINRFYLIDYIAKGMMIYKGLMMKFLKNYNPMSAVYNYITKVKLLDKYTKFVNIDNRKISQFGSDTICITVKGTPFSILVNMCENGMLNIYNSKNILNDLLSNYIITNDMADMYREKPINNKRWRQNMVEKKLETKVKIKVGDTVKVINSTLFNGHYEQLIHIGTICKVTSVENNVVGLVPISDPDVEAYYYLDNEVEKGELIWTRCK